MLLPHIPYNFIELINLFQQNPPIFADFPSIGLMPYVMVVMVVVVVMIVIPPRIYHEMYRRNGRMLVGRLRRLVMIDLYLRHDLMNVVMGLRWDTLVVMGKRRREESSVPGNHMVVISSLMSWRGDEACDVWGGPVLQVFRNLRQVFRRIVFQFNAWV